MAGFSFKVTRNDISPKLAAMARAAKNPEPVFRAMGTQFFSLTMGNFEIDPSYRPHPWPNKKDGSPSTLRLNNVLSKSFHLEVTNSYAKVGTPVIYSRIHQFGGKTRPHEIWPKQKKALAFDGKVFGKVKHPGSNIPARPFFPVENGKLTPAAEEKIQKAGERAMKRQIE